MYTNLVKSIAPDLAEVTLRFANFERRLENLDAAVSIYVAAMARLSERQDSAATNSAADVGSASAGLKAKMLAFLAISCARLQERVMQDAVAARATFATALEQCPAELQLWLAALNFEAGTNSGRPTQTQSKAEGSAESAYAALDAIYTRALADDSGLSARDKVCGGSAAK